MYSIKLSDYRMGTKFDKNPLAVEQNNYLNEIVNFHLAYDLNAWPKIQLRNFIIKNCLFRATSIVKNNDKEKYVYSGYGIAFDGKGGWSFDNETARNVVVFGVDNGSSSHADNFKNNFLVLGEWDTFGIKVGPHPPKKVCFILFNESSLQMLKNAFYFI